MPSHEVRRHYEQHPYPAYPLLSSVRRCDTYALNVQALWARFNGRLPVEKDVKILIGGSGTFAPYPMGVANPQAEITALDLSENNLHRAKLHCTLHRCCNVRFRQGDLLNPEIASDRFHFIDSYGVLHHLDEPIAGLKALERRLASGGILRIMVYGRYARQEAESIRRAMRLLGIRTIADLMKLLRKAGPGSRIRSYLDASWEARSVSGLADMFLHPCVHTYRIEEFLDMVHHTSLKPLLFAHEGALLDPADEVKRLRELDRRRETPTNIVCYLGLGTEGPCPIEGDTLLQLNPCLTGAVSLLRLLPVTVMPRLGHPNPPLDYNARRFLRCFRSPVTVSSLTKEDVRNTASFLGAGFLMTFRQNYHAVSHKNDRMVPKILS